jgi:hypothetical protein
MLAGIVNTREHILACPEYYVIETATCNLFRYKLFQTGIVVAGGYYNGISTMFAPLRGFPSEWRWLGNLPEERKWGPALGHVDGVLTVAGGGNYGDETVDELRADGHNAI